MHGFESTGRAQRLVRRLAIGGGGGGGGGGVFVYSIDIFFPERGGSFHQNHLFPSSFSSSSSRVLPRRRRFSRALNRNPRPRRRRR